MKSDCLLVKRYLKGGGDVICISRSYFASKEFKITKPTGEIFDGIILTLGLSRNSRTEGNIKPISQFRFKNKLNASLTL